MSAAALAMLASAVSLVAVLALGYGDPKRRRTASLSTGRSSHDRRRRQLLATAALLPGAVVVLVDRSLAAFFIWLGALTVIGWAVAVGFAAVDRHTRDRSDQPRQPVGDRS